jgi:NTE family protein
MRKTVTLALQGGASFGAYTWGVLDGLLEDERFEIEGITASSAGAINAVALAAGAAAAGRKGSRQVLREFWEGLADAAESRRRPGRFSGLGAVLRGLRAPRSIETFLALTTRIAADFDIDPESMQPLRGVLDSTIDFEKIQTTSTPAVFVNVTDVRTRTLRVFAKHELTTDVVCASCCVPLLFAPVAIGDDLYWDGCFLGNPAIYPVLYECESADVLLIETRPHERLGAPRSARELLSRVVELSSSAGLARELRMIDFVSDLVRRGVGGRDAREGRLARLREIRIHRIATPPRLVELEGANAFRADRPYFEALFALGRDAALAWLERVPEGWVDDETRLGRPRDRCGGPGA